MTNLPYFFSNGGVDVKLALSIVVHVSHALIYFLFGNVYDRLLLNYGSINFEWRAIKICIYQLHSAINTNVIVLGNVSTCWKFQSITNYFQTAKVNQFRFAWYFNHLFVYYTEHIINELIYLCHCRF